MIIDDLKKAINESDIYLARAVILRQINSDKDREHFWMLESVAYAEGSLADKGIALFKEDDGDTELIIDKLAWTVDYWQLLRVRFDRNFSREKFEFIVEMMRYFREQGIPEFQVAEQKSNSTSPTQTREKNTSNSQQQDSSKHQHSKSNTQDYFIGSASGAVILGTAAKLLGYSVVGGVVVGAIIGAGVVYLKNRETF